MNVIHLRARPASIKPYVIDRARKSAKRLPSNLSAAYLLDCMQKYAAGTLNHGAQALRSARYFSEPDLPPGNALLLCVDALLADDVELAIDNLIRADDLLRH